MLKKFKCVSDNVDLDDYLKLYNYVRDNMEHPEWLGTWNILKNKEVSKYYLVGKINNNWEDEKKWQYKKLEKANDKDVFQWSIVLKSEDCCIGQVSCQKSCDDLGNTNPDNIRDVGWFLDLKYHGKGLGTEAAKLMVDYMFNEVCIDKIETSAAIENPASWKIMEKFGFIRTSKIKKVKYTFIPEEVDCYCYEISRENYLINDKT